MSVKSKREERDEREREKRERREREVRGLGPLTGMPPFFFLVGGCRYSRTVPLRGMCMLILVCMAGPEGYVCALLVCIACHASKAPGVLLGLKP